MCLHASDAANLCWNWSWIFVIYSSWFSKFDEEDERMGHKSNADTHILKRTKHISAFLSVLKLYSWRWLVVGGGHFSLVSLLGMWVYCMWVWWIRALRFTSLPPHSVWHSQWPLTNENLLLGLIPSHCAFIMQRWYVVLLLDTSWERQRTPRILLIECCQGIWIMPLWGKKLVSPNLFCTFKWIFCFISRVSLFKMLHHNLKTQWSSALYCESEV